MTPKSIALFYGHVSSNIGDVAINRGTVNLLRSAWPGAEICVVLLGVEQSPHLEASLASFGGREGLRFVHLEPMGRSALDFALDPASLLPACGCEEADLVVMAAGEHLFGYERNPNHRNLFWRTLPAFAARAAGKPCVLMPSTFGPYETAQSRALMTRLAAAGPRFAVRDLRSRETLSGFVPAGPVAAALDPAFFLEPPADAGGAAPSGRIGIVMRSEGWGLRLAREDRADFDRAVAEAGQEASLAFRFTRGLASRILAETEHKVRLFVQLEADRAIADAVVEMLAGIPGSDRLEIVAPGTIDDYLASLAEVDCVVASRFHALVLGMVCSKPGLGVYFDAHGHKIPGLFDLLERPEDCINLSTTPTEQAVDTMFARVRAPVDFTPVGTRIAALRETTRLWLADATPAFAAQTQPPLESVRVLAELAFLMNEDVHETETRKFRTRANQFRREMEAARAEASAHLSAGGGTEHERLAALIEQKRALEAELARAVTLADEKQAEATKFSTQARRLKRELNKASELIEKTAAERHHLAETVRREATRLEALGEEKQALETQLAQAIELADTNLARAREFSRQAYGLKRGLDLANGLIASLKKREQALKKARSETARADAKRILALERRLEQLENSISLRLGTALVAAAKSPRSAAALPTDVWRLLAEHRSRPRPAPVQPGLAPAGMGTDSGRDPAQGAEAKPALIQLFEREGAAGVIRHIETEHPTDRFAQRNALIAASKLLLEEGFPDAELDLTRRAVALDGSDSSLRALHWAAQRGGDYATAWECIRKIEALYGAKPKPAQKTLLDKLRRSPAYQLSLLDGVPEAPERRIDPVPNRLCYVLHNSLPYSSGGYATRAQGLALGLTGAGFEVVALSRPGFPLDIKPELSAGQVALEETIEGIVHRRTLSPLRTGLSALDYMNRAADAITAELERIRPAAVMAASNHLTAIPSLIAARRLGLAFFYEVRGFWEITRISREPDFEASAAFKVQKLLETEAARRADHVFTLTGPMRDELIRRGIPAGQITLLPNSCEPGRFSPRARDAALAERLGIPADVPVIGYIGTFVQYEGLELLVAAATALRDRGHAFRLLLVGNENASGTDVGPITTEIRRIAHERGLTDWLIMPGRVPHEQVEAYYSLVDIAPFPRKAQPVTELVSPMKPLEAYAMEKAVVVSSVGALLEMVEDGRTGLVFEKDSVDDLATVLARLITDPDLRTRLGKAGRRWVEAERTWDATARRAAERIRQFTSENEAEPPVALNTVSAR